MPRANLSRNPSCANDTSNWMSGIGWTRITGQTVASTGKTTAGRVTVGTGSYPDVGSAGTAAATNASASGRAISYLAWVRSSVARNVDHGISKYNGTSFQSFAVATTRVALSANTWTLVRGTGTVSSGGTYDRIGVHFDLPTGASGTLDVAAVRIELDVTDSTMAFADGDTSGWAWDGTAGSSTSQESSAVQKSGGDSGTGSESGTVTVPRAGADSGTGAETGAVSATTTGTDTGAGAETGYVAVPRAGADTGSGTETGNVAVAQTGNDAGLGGGGGSVSATTTGADSGTGASSGAISANTVAAPDAGVGAETGSIRIPGADTAAGTDQLGSLLANVASAEQGAGSEGGYVETRYGELVVSVYAVTPTGLVALPDFLEVSIAPTRNGPGSISLTYPAAGLNFSVLRSTVTADRDLEVEVWTFGSPVGARRGYLQEASGDDVAEGAVWQFTGGFAELRMAEAIVFPQPLTGEVTLGDNVQVAKSSVTTAQWTRLTATLGYTPSSDTDPTVSVPQKVLDAVKANAASIPVLADPKRELQFAAVTPGAMIHFVLAQARARGGLTDITTSFTATSDTAGNPWPSLVSTKFSPGTAYDSILNLLAQLGRAEWSVNWTGTAYCLNLWVAGKRGGDLTVGARPVVLRAGRNLAEAPRKWSVRSSPTAMLGIGAEGWYADTSDANARARRGRRIEASTSSQNLATSDAVLNYAQRRLSTDNPGTLEVTHELALLPGEPRPIIAFDVGDFLYSSVTPTLDRYRVVEWSLTVDAARQLRATVTLNDAFVDAVTRARQQLDALSAGETVVGTSEAGNQTDTTPPSRPTGLLISSGAFNSGIDAYAVVLVGWTAPTTNVDGTALTNLAGYRVEWTEYAQPTKWRAAATVDGSVTQAQFTTAIGLPILVRVAAYKASGAQSTWLTLSAPHTTEVDTTPPPTTSAPTGANYFGLIQFAWDGKSADGADMFAAAPDFSHAELHISTASMFSPTAATMADQILGRGTYTYSKLPDGSPLVYGVTYYCRLVPVDIRGNRQPTPSGQASATPGQLLGPDIFDGAVGSAKLQDLAVVTAKIADLAVNNAKIADLSVGKLTAGILTASMVVGTGAISTRTNGNSGPGVTTDSVGLRLYDSAGNVTVQFKGADGSAMISGEYRTSLTTGTRLVFNPNGSSPGEIRVYPSSTNQYGRVKAVTSVAIGFENQAGINMKAFSPRQDGQSGEVNVFPGLASLVWGNEVDNGSITARIAVSQAENYIGGQRTRVVADPSAGGDFRGFLAVGADNGQGTGYKASTVLSFTDSNDNGTGNARLRNFDRNSGIQFDTGIISIVQTNGAACRFQAATHETFSSILHKTAVEDLPFDTLQVISAATARRYERIDEQHDPARRKYIGLIAEDLPDPLTVDLGEGRGLGVDLYAIATTSWEGVRVLNQHVSALSARVAELEALCA